LRLAAYHMRQFLPQPGLLHAGLRLDFTLWLH